MGTVVYCYGHSGLCYNEICEIYWNGHLGVSQSLDLENTIRDICIVEQNRKVSTGTLFKIVDIQNIRVVALNILIRRFSEGST